MANIKVGIADDAKSFVQATAAQDQISEADVVRKALEAYRFLRSVEQTDGEVLLKRKNGSTERLVRF